MRSILRVFMPLFLAAAMTAPLMSGCAVHARVYDPYSREYYPWVNERGYYGQWENETHRDHHNYQRRNEEEQREYWQWRHRHGDRNYDRDRDHDRDHDRH